MTGGRCHCGAVRYRVEGEPRHVSVCHCEDCRRCAGAAGVAWMAVASDEFTIVEGEPALYRSSADAERYFCGACGTGLYYVNEKVLPGLVDIQTATLDDPENYPPQIHVQVADELPWEATLGELPRFDRYPG
ncbi:GFA family protein [Altererythrobacter sp. C41]|uniref:GFA family protein n=1 Tax=Altererythrobacter sp. C41 TaxID=2806021 RepID=UPI0019341F72|nr:GFA family protein [Altererythrobacter sp. C41]MBM0170161.1 GFA family protein [Altererythrobacter sp. C41]